MRRLLPLLLFVMALFSVSLPAYACSCMEPDAGQLLVSSPAAFVGTVIGITPVGTERSMTFDVETVFAGEVPEEFSVLAGTADGASCGLGANVGSRLAIFTHQDDTGALHASSCGAMDADTALQALGTGYPPAGEAAPSAPMDWQLVWLAVGALGLVSGAWLVMRRSA